MSTSRSPTIWATRVTLFTISTRDISIAAAPLRWGVCRTLCLLDLEVDRENEVHVHRTTALGCRTEPPALDGVDRRLVEAHRQALEHPRVLRLPGAVDVRLDDDDALHAGTPRGLGVDRLHAVDHHRRRDVAADPQDLVAGAARGTARRATGYATGHAAGHATLDAALDALVGGRNLLDRLGLRQLLRHFDRLHGLLGNDDR